MRCDKDCLNCVFPDCIITQEELLHPKKTHEEVLEYQRERYKRRKEKRRKGKDD